MIRRLIFHIRINTTGQAARVSNPATGFSHPGPTRAISPSRVTRVPAASLMNTQLVRLGNWALEGADELQLHGSLKHRDTRGVRRAARDMHNEARAQSGRTRWLLLDRRPLRMTGERMASFCDVIERSGGIHRHDEARGESHRRTIGDRLACLAHRGWRRQ